MGISDRIVSLGTAFSLFFVLISVYLRGTQDELQDRLVNVINGLKLVEEQHRNLSPRVAVGFGACVDLFVNGKDLLAYHEGISSRHHDFLSTYEEVLESYSYYFQHGAASERFMTNSSLFDELVAAAESRTDSRYDIGGNAATMAMRMHQEGCQVLLAASLSSKYLNYIPKGIKVVGIPVTRDDIHLILEYKAGEDWGPHTAPRANRYIIHNDYHNPRLSSLQNFNNELKQFEPDVFVISGLQLMDNYKYNEGENVRENSLREIKENILQLPRATKTHFEMASYAEIELMNELKEQIIPFCNSLGMNEQELTNLYNLYLYGNISVVTDSQPRVATVLDQMRYIFRTIKKTSANVPGHKTLTRIHVHTLAFQAIMTDVQSPWKQTDVAAAKASLTAYRHVCASSEVEPNEATILMDDSFSRSAVGPTSGRVVLEPERPVPCWEEDHAMICIAAGIVCKNAQQTAGGGDNISSAALAMQL